MATAMPKYLNTQLGLIYLYKSHISSKTLTNGYSVQPEEQKKSFVVYSGWLVML